MRFGGLMGLPHTARQVEADAPIMPCQLPLRAPGAPLEAVQPPGVVWEAWATRLNLVRLVFSGRR